MHIKIHFEYSIYNFVMNICWEQKNVNKKLNTHELNERDTRSKCISILNESLKAVKSIMR